MEENWRDSESPEKNPNALAYGISPSAPSSIHPVDIGKWKGKIAPTFRSYFQERYDDLVRQFQALAEEFNINQLVYESSISFEPVIGKVYHLYQKQDGTRFLSLVDPNETFWGGYIGTFRMTAQYTWKKV